MPEALSGLINRQSLPAPETFKPKLRQRESARTLKQRFDSKASQENIMKNLKLTIIGGGSSYTPELFDGIIRRIREQIGRASV